MDVHEMPIDQIKAAPWNPNEMDQSMRERLRSSIVRFGLVAPLVVRRTGDDRYETIGGAHRLSILEAMGRETVPVVIVLADNAEARLLSQALNHISGEENPGLRGEVLKEVLEKIPQRDVMALLPETAKSLSSLTSLGKEAMAEHLKAWQEAQAARLKHFSAQLTETQMKVVEEALDRFHSMASPGDEDNPNVRGLALYHLCRSYLEDLEGRR